jgi:hypothetical protein
MEHFADVIFPKILVGVWLACLIGAVIGSIFEKPLDCEPI